MQQLTHYNFMNQPHPQQVESNSIKLNSVQYVLKEDPFIVPVRFKKELPLNKNIFELNEPEPKNYRKKQEKQEMTQTSMMDPLQMNVASIKLLLAEKSLAYSATFSIIVSIYDIYASQPQSEINQFITILNLLITVLLVVLVGAGAHFHAESNASRKISQKLFVVRHFLKAFLVLLAPNPWLPQINKFLHLTLLLRLYFPIVYFIRSSIYYQPRAARIINIYGIKPELTFQFAWKVILNHMPISLVLLFYILVVLFYSHCLYLVTEQASFIDCFQIVIVTLPTIGFGDYKVQSYGPRWIILCILVTGVSLNAFVTLTMLKKFEMTISENNSFTLMEKLKMVQEIQTLSSQFIIRKIRVKNKNKSNSELERDQSFKQQYKECKARYRMLNPQDSVYQFNYFKNCLQELKIKIQQSNNMIVVLLSRLITHRKQSKSQLKEMINK